MAGDNTENRIPKLSGPTERTINFKSMLDDIYKTFTPESIVNKYNKSKTFEDFGVMQRQFTNDINQLFKGYISGYSEVIKSTFRRGSLMGFNGSDDERDELLPLIYQKNRLYYECMLKYIENGGIDRLLIDTTTGNEKIHFFDKQDIILLLKSSLLSIFDDIFINWLEIGEHYKDGIPEGEIYGGINNIGVVPYSKFTNYKLPGLGDISNKLLHDYIKGIIRLSGMFTEWENWEGNLTNEPRIWQDKSSKLGFVGPQEMYYLQSDKGQLVEPHIALYIKQAIDKEKKDAVSLYDKYFGKNYNVSKLQTFLAEPIFEAGSIGFQKIAGESIPNPYNVRKQFGEINLVIPSRLSNRMLEGLPYLEQVLGGKKISDEELKSVINESSKFVKFHELGHSLFKNGDYKNELEELKADLSYFLKIYDEIQEGEEQPIEEIFYHFLIDGLRVFRNINLETGKINENMKQYVIALSIELRQAFETGFLKFKGEKLTYNARRFEIFICKMKELLFEIKSSYDKESDDTKQDILDRYYNLNDENIMKLVMVSNLNLN